jgi:hypothetical protein
VSLQILKPSTGAPESFIVRNALILALGRYWISLGAQDPAFMADLQKLSRESYGSLTVMYAGVQVLWIVLTIYSGGLVILQVVESTANLASFTVQQINIIVSMGGVKDDVTRIADTVGIVHQALESAETMRSILASVDPPVINAADVEKYASNLAAIKDTVLLVLPVAVDFAMTDDIPVMATAWLAAGNYAAIDAGVAQFMSDILDSIVDGSVTPPLITLMLSLDVMYWKCAMLMWYTLWKMYQYIESKGTLNFWYWALHAPEGVQHYRGLYESYKQSLDDSSNRINSVYEKIEQLYQECEKRAPQALEFSSTAPLTFTLLPLPTLAAAATQSVFNNRIRRRKGCTKMVP